MSAVVKMRPRRAANNRKYSEVRDREYLTEDEVLQLVKAAEKTRHAIRDAALVLVAFSHGLRAGEICGARWGHLSWQDQHARFPREKNGIQTTSPLRPDEMRKLKALKRSAKTGNDYIFLSERGAPLTPNGVWRIIKKLGELAGFTFPLHPHMLRHACGYELINRGADIRQVQHIVGHRTLKHTMRYTALSARTIRNVWEPK